MVTQGIKRLFKRDKKDTKEEKKMTPLPKKLMAAVMILCVSVFYEFQFFLKNFSSISSSCNNYRKMGLFSLEIQ